MRRLVAVPRRIEFVVLRTDCSPPVALHAASGRRSYLQLRSLWLSPTRTFTVLMQRPHGRTHSRERGNPGHGQSSLDARLRGHGELGFPCRCMRSHAHLARISPNLASTEGKGFKPSPREKSIDAPFLHQPREEYQDESFYCLLPDAHCLTTKNTLTNSPHL